MNPLKRVRPDWATIGIQNNSEFAFMQRPNLAVLVSQCIGTSSEVETWLGLILANLTKADAATTIAMFNSVQSRSAQLSMLKAAAETALKNQQDDLDLFNAVLRASVVPAMKERDRLAHWQWGITEAMPDDLLIIDPVAERDLLLNLLKGINIDIDSRREHMYVVTKQDLIGILERLGKSKTFTAVLSGLFWVEAETARAESHRRLSREPLIREAIDRIRAERQRTD